MERSWRVLKVSDRRTWSSEDANAVNDEQKLVATDLCYVHNSRWRSLTFSISAVPKCDVLTAAVEDLGQKQIKERLDQNRTSKATRAWTCLSVYRRERIWLWRVKYMFSSQKNSTPSSYYYFNKTLTSDDVMICLNSRAEVIPTVQVITGGQNTLLWERPNQFTRVFWNIDGYRCAVQDEVTWPTRPKSADFLRSVTETPTEGLQEAEGREETRGRKQDSKLQCRMITRREPHEDAELRPPTGSGAVELSAVTGCYRVLLHT